MSALNFSRPLIGFSFHGRRSIFPDGVEAGKTTKSKDNFQCKFNCFVVFCSAF